MALTKFKYKQTTNPLTKEKKRTPYEVKVTAKEAKATIMRAHGWTAEQYQKQYDLFKNKLRAYESYKAGRLGLTVEEQKRQAQSPQEILYKQAMTMLNEGSEYMPSLEMQRIQAFPAVSISKGYELGRKEGTKYLEARAKTFAKYTSLAFEGFINRYAKAAEIAANITDPVKQEKALAALANHLHEADPRVSHGEVPKQAIPDGQTAGSSDARFADDFDYSEWL